MCEVFRSEMRIIGAGDVLATVTGRRVDLRLGNAEPPVPGVDRVAKGLAVGALQVELDLHLHDGGEAGVS